MNDTCEFTHSSEEVAACLQLWGLELARLREDLDVAGSPERCRQRMVVEEEKGGLFLLEEIVPDHRGRKQAIASCLDALAARGMSLLNPYLKGGHRETVLHHRGSYWQVSPYIAGTCLHRPHYVMEAWRAPLLADFLIALRQAVDREPPVDADAPFSIRRYILSIVEQMAVHDPRVLPPLQPVLEALNKGFMGVHDHLPTAFCHGDYHPLNIIWGSDRIKAVIDWEFCGTRPELYDVANMVGCLGIEDPAALAGALVETFISRLKAAGLFADISWHYLPELVVALRFGWLAEWLRNGDEEMIRLETDYMRLLIAHWRDLPLWPAGRG